MKYGNAKLNTRVINWDNLKGTIIRFPMKMDYATVEWDNGEISDTPLSHLEITTK